MIKTYTRTVPDDCLLKDFLVHQMHLTRHQIRQAKFRQDGILVNGIRQRITCSLKRNDIVKICLEDDSVQGARLVPCQIMPHILYEDEDVILLDKPAGTVVHPSHGHYADSLANQLASYFHSQNVQIKIRPIGRLDKETSGVVLFAKNQAAAQRLSMQKSAGIFYKEYIALVSGHLDMADNTISAPIFKDPDDLIRMCISSKGKPAITHYHVERELDGCSMIRLHLETGRTHQIRVHMASIGHPLLGDLLYGKPHPVLQRAALHAWKIHFIQPFTGRPIELCAPVPDDISSYLKNMHCL